jgi:hypothetical protein
MCTKVHQRSALLAIATTRHSAATQQLTGSLLESDSLTIVADGLNLVNPAQTKAMSERSLLERIATQNSLQDS